jgi:hypothetical protein
LAVLLFAFALDRVRVVPVVGEMLATARGAAATMKDSALDDRAREKAVQRASIQLFSHAASIFGRAALALIVSLIPMVIGDQLGLTTMGGVIAFLSRFDVILIASVGFIVLYFARMRMWPSN